jgi:hypothetical protein
VPLDAGHAGRPYPYASHVHHVRGAVALWRGKRVHSKPKTLWDRRANLGISAGVPQTHKEDRGAFSTLAPWPGRFICAECRYREARPRQPRAAIFIGGSEVLPDTAACTMNPWP